MQIADYVIMTYFLPSTEYSLLYNWIARLEIYVIFVLEMSPIYSTSPLTCCLKTSAHIFRLRAAPHHQSPSNSWVHFACCSRIGLAYSARTHIAKKCPNPSPTSISFISIHSLSSFLGIVSDNSCNINFQFQLLHAQISSDSILLQ